MNVKIYGIPNCDTMKKAMNWLDDQGISYEFHNYKKLGIGQEKLMHWLAQTNWEVLVNRKGTTWKKLSPDQQLAINTEDKAMLLMQHNTSLIKRPIIETDGVLAGVGFEDEAWRKIFA